MKIPVIIASEDGYVFYLQFGRFKKRLAPKLSPCYNNEAQLFWHDGRKKRYEYETLMRRLIIQEENSLIPSFKVCQYQSATDFSKGIAVSYIDFYDWLKNLKGEASYFYSTSSILDSYCNYNDIELPKNYRHPIWLTDIFTLLDAPETAKTQIISKEQLANYLRIKQQDYLNISSRT